MKKTASTLVLLFAAAASHAVVSIGWSSPTNTVTKVDNTDAPYTWYAQLVWSSINTPSAINPTNPFLVAPGEQILIEQRLNTGSTTDGRIRTSPTTSDYSDDLEDGFLYTRVFNVNYSLTPGMPTLYGISQVTGNPFNLFNGGLMITVSDPNTGNLHNPVVKVDQPYAAIPEPSSFALMLFGAAAFAWRRRRAS